MSDGDRRKKGSRVKRAPEKKEAPPGASGSVDAGGGKTDPAAAGKDASSREAAPPKKAPKKRAPVKETAAEDGGGKKGAGKRGAAKEPAAGGAARKAEPDPKAAPSAGSSSEDAAPRRKITLPAFGLAEDLLRDLRRKREAEAAAESADESADDTDADAGADPAETADEAASGLDSGDPERIFDFADRLQGGARADEEGRRERQQLEPYVTFDLADEVFALPVQPIREVMRIAAITRVPHAPRPIRGVTNLRGRVIPVIDLRQRIGLPPAEIEKTARIIVVAARQRLIGLLVDGVRQVVHLDLLKVQPPPEDVMTVQADYISGICQLDRELVLLLDVERSLVVKEPGVA